MEKLRGLDMAVPYKVCPVTGEHISQDLLIRTTGKNSSTMPLVYEENMTLQKAMHNKCIGVSETLAEKALKDIGEGFYLVEYDESKTTEEMHKQGNPYRTGRIIGLKKECWARWFPKSPFPENQWSYIPAPFVENIMKQTNGPLPEN